MTTPTKPNPKARKLGRVMLSSVDDWGLAVLGYLPPDTKIGNAFIVFRQSDHAKAVEAMAAALLRRRFWPSLAKILIAEKTGDAWQQAINESTAALADLNWHAPTKL